MSTSQPIPSETHSMSLCIQHGLVLGDDLRSHNVQAETELNGLRDTLETMRAALMRKDMATLTSILQAISDKSIAHRQPLAATVTFAAQLALPTSSGELSGKDLLALCNEHGLVYADDLRTFNDHATAELNGLHDMLEAARAAFLRKDWPTLASVLQV
jgi:hypothetical protein